MKRAHRICDELTIETDNTGLIGLSNIGEDAVDHADQHAVLERVTGVLDNGNDVCAVGSHVDQITTGAVRELDGKHGALGANNIGNVRHTGTRGSTKVEHLASRTHVDVVDTTEDTGRQFTPERVPHAVFGAARGCILAVCGSGRSAYADALLAVDTLAGRQVLGDEEIFLAAGDEDTGVAMGLDNDLAVAE